MQPAAAELGSGSQGLGPTSLPLLPTVSALRAYLLYLRMVARVTRRASVLGSTCVNLLSALLSNSNVAHCVRPEGVHGEGCARFPQTMSCPAGLSALLRLADRDQHAPRGVPGPTAGPAEHNSCWLRSPSPRFQSAPESTLKAAESQGTEQTWSQGSSHPNACLRGAQVADLSLHLTNAHSDHLCAAAAG